MKTNYFLSTLAICALTLVGCSSNNNEELNIKKNCKTGDVSADIPVTYEEISLSPEENELFLIEGIHDIIAEDRTLNTIVEEYKQLNGINEEIIITPNLYEDLYNCCMNRYYCPNISNIEDTNEIQEHLRTYTNNVYSDIFYTTITDMVSSIVENTEINVDYGQFTTEEAYLISNLVALCKSMKYYAFQFTKVAYAASSESDCWNNFCREISIEFGYAALNAIISGGISAAAALSTGPVAIILIIANTASTAMTVLQVCNNVKRIYAEYAACLDLATTMENNGITIIDTPNEDENNDENEESQWDNWISFFNCHIIKPSVLLPQITACLQAQLIIQ